MTSPQLIADSYERYHFSVYLYIYNKVNNKEEAEDLSQDVFVRLMDYKRMLRPDTVKFFIYTISRNLVNDYLRRYYKKQEITSYMYDRTEVSHNEVESCVVADDLLACEKRRVEFLPRSFEVKTPDVVIKVNPERTDLVNTKLIDGRQCLVIELYGTVEVNGIAVNPM